MAFTARPGSALRPLAAPWPAATARRAGRRAAPRAAAAAAAARGPAAAAASTVAGRAAAPATAAAASPSAAAEKGGRFTKIVATIGPASNSRAGLRALAAAGMNVVRLNMSHGDHASHAAVVALVREYNAEAGRGAALAIMLDTKGPEVRSGDLAAPLRLVAGDELVFTTDAASATGGAAAAGGAASGAAGMVKTAADASQLPRVSVNYDGFVADVSVGDTLLVDGGLMAMAVVAVAGADVRLRVLDGGLLESRRHLNIRGRSANLPAITERDWADIRFGVAAGVDFFALSFVRDAGIIHELKAFLAAEGRTGTEAIGVLAKIESADSVRNLEAILDAADGAMVARGDLGAELPIEDVPYWQKAIVDGCAARGKPSIVATHLLESMCASPVPTRAEVSDIANAVREGADAVMLSGETAHGAYPLRALETMAAVAARAERGAERVSGARRFGGDAAPAGGAPPRGAALDAARDSRALSRVVARHAAHVADTVGAPLVVFTRRGSMPALLSNNRPAQPIYAFTDDAHVQRRLALLRGVTALLMPFSASAEATFAAALEELRARGLVAPGRVVVLAQSGKRPIWRDASTHTLQLRAAPGGATASMDEEP